MTMQFAKSTVSNDDYRIAFGKLPLVSSLLGNVSDLDTVSDLATVSHLDTLQIDYEPGLSTLWVTMRHPGKPCLTSALIRDFNALSEAIRLEHGRAVPSSRQPIKFVVLRSSSSKVFNLGGDLDLFVDAIAAGDGEALQAYGRAGAGACGALAFGFDASIVTISLVRGVAIGGGFEAARCCDLMVAEEGATFQLPEAGFGLFAASGIMSVIAPRIGHKATRRLVIDGEKLDCAAAADIDLVDEVAPADAGEAKVRSLIARLAPRHAAAVATYRGLNRMNGVTGEATARRGRLLGARRHEPRTREPGDDAPAVSGAGQTFFSVEQEGPYRCQ